MNRSELKQHITQLAKQHGFYGIGFSKAQFLEEEETRLASWLKNNNHGEMSYMENHFDMRLDPRILVPGSKTVISFLYNYYNELELNADGFKISKYAYGEDYHDVIKQKLRVFVDEVKQVVGDIEGRVFVDSAPVLEKAWAQKSGLGWIGKNSNLINPKAGSFYFLAEWICDLDLEPDSPIKDYCGTCTRCIDACPTDAITDSYIVDGSKCISYATIELRKDDLPAEFKGNMENWIYGCDICQDVCPWNRFSIQHTEERFQPKEHLFSMSTSDWEDLTEDVYRELFRKSAVKRTRFEGLKRNIRFVSGQES